MAKHDTTPQSELPASVTYAVLVSFTDSEDGGTVYWAGQDQYPRAGYEPTEERIAYLQGNANKLKTPVIACGIAGDTKG